MPLSKPRYLTTFSLLVGLFFIPLASAENPAVVIDQLSTTETAEKWGQVLFCQRMYNMPEVKSRLYDFDTEHCNQAALLVAEVVSKYSMQEQDQLKFRAERHAVALSYNTSEPYHSVGACRQYCQKLTEVRRELE